MIHSDYIQYPHIQLNLHSRLECGIGLPEVMITLLLLSTGSLALTQLQLKNLQSAYQSYQDSRLTLLHGEAIERLWQQRCYLSNMNDTERESYLIDAFPDVFSHASTDILAPTQVWLNHKPVVIDC